MIVLSELIMLLVVTYVSKLCHDTAFQSLCYLIESCSCSQVRVSCSLEKDLKRVVGRATSLFNVGETPNWSTATDFRFPRMVGRSRLLNAALTSFEKLHCDRLARAFRCLRGFRCLDLAVFDIPIWGKKLLRLSSFKCFHGTFICVLLLLDDVCSGDAAVADRGSGCCRAFCTCSSRDTSVLAGVVAGLCFPLGLRRW